MNADEDDLVAAVVELGLAVVQLALVVAGGIAVMIALVMVVVEAVAGDAMPAAQCVIVGIALILTNRVVGWATPWLRARVVRRLTRNRAAS